jgi:hypothetical protein
VRFRWADEPRFFTLVVYPSVAAITAAYVQATGEDPPENLVGCCHGYDNPRRIGLIRVTSEGFEEGTLVHEAVHLAVWLLKVQRNVDFLHLTYQIEESLAALTDTIYTKLSASYHSLETSWT